MLTLKTLCWCGEVLAIKKCPSFVAIVRMCALLVVVVWGFTLKHEEPYRHRLYSYVNRKFRAITTVVPSACYQIWPSLVYIVNNIWHPSFDSSSPPGWVPILTAKIASPKLLIPSTNFDQKNNDDKKSQDWFRLERASKTIQMLISPSTVGVDRIFERKGKLVQDPIKHFTTHHHLLPSINNHGDGHPPKVESAMMAF